MQYKDEILLHSVVQIQVRGVPREDFWHQAAWRVLDRTDGHGGEGGERDS